MAFSKLTQQSRIPNAPIDRRCPACRQLGIKILIDPEVGDYVYCLNCHFFSTAASLDWTLPEHEFEDSEECPKCHRLIESACPSC